MRYEIMSFASPRISHDEKRRENPFLVVHPGHDAVLAYCATMDEAVGVVDAINEMCARMEKKLMANRGAPTE